MGDVTSAFDRGNRRSRRPRTRPRTGLGLAWLVAEKVAPGYRCYWYGGRSDGTLWEFGRAGSAREAVTWGLARTARVRIRDADGTTAWAGTTARPEGIGLTWSDPAIAIPS